MTGDLVRHALKHAPESVDHAEDVLQFFCEAVEFDHPPDRRILEYLARSFRLILDGSNADAALGLKGRPKGQRRRRTSEAKLDKDLELARAVARRMRHGESRDDAIEAVATEAGASAARTKKAYDALRDLVRRAALD